MSHHQSGRLSQAEPLYLKVLKLAPRHADAHQFLGMLRYQQGNTEDALVLLQKACELAPDNPSIQNNLGNLHMAASDWPEAETAYREAITLDPEHADARFNLGTAFRQHGKHEDAVAAYECALQIQPNNTDGLYGLGIALRKLDRLDEAESAYRKVIEIRPVFVEAHFSLGTVLKRQQRLQEAETAYRAAMEIDPDFLASYESLGVLLYMQDKTDAAAAVYRDWLGRDPSSAVAAHMLAACSGEETPERASDAYVTELFDRFAKDFDENLKNLDYRVPELLCDALTEKIGAAPNRLDILDAGCGTGLCGPLLRPLSRRLVGIDLSDGMLDKARASGVYDELQSAELTEYMTNHEGQFDVVVSGDTLVYFGDLSAPLRACRLSLRKGGTLAFTVEHLGLVDDHFQLNPHGRYSHTHKHIRRALKTSGFDTLAIDETVLRQ